MAKRSIALVGLVMMCLWCSSAFASPIDYSILFHCDGAMSCTAGSPAPTAGSFTYDAANSTISNFVVNWFGITFDLTSVAGNPVFLAGDGSGPQSFSTMGCIDGATGAAATFRILAGCNDANDIQTWTALTESSDRAFRFQVHDLETDSYASIDYFVAGPGPGGGSWGDGINGHVYAQNVGWTGTEANSVAISEPDTLATMGVSLFGLLTLACRNRSKIQD